MPNKKIKNFLKFFSFANLFDEYTIFIKIPLQFPIIHNPRDY